MSSQTPKNVIITGSARGIGRVIARYLLIAGHKVFLIDVDEKELAYCVNEHLPAALAAANKDNNSQSETSKTSLESRVSSAVANLRSPEAIHDAIKAAAKFFDNKIDVLVNNAGIARAGWPDNKTMEDDVVADWQAYVETNLTAPFLLSRACIPYMKACEKPREPGSAVLSPEVSGNEKSEPGSCVIHISSFRAKQSQANTEGYGSTKAGVLGLTHSMAVSGAQWGIRCNAILPGYIEVTHECKEGDEKKTPWAVTVSEERHRTHLVGRIGLGTDIAKAVEYLMDAGFVTGQELVVDGGVSKIKFDHA